MKKTQSLRARLIIPLLFVTVIGFGGMIVFSVQQIRDYAKTEALKYSKTLAESKGHDLTQDFDEAFVFARAFRDQLVDMKKKQNFNRTLVAELLQAVTEGNKKIIGFYTLWEPNAFDGKDSEYVGKPLHDGSGRLNVYTYRSQGKVSLTVNEHYEKEGLGDYYLIPKKRQKETMIDPYLYPVDGQDVAMVSIIVPIMDNNQFLGIVGVDISIADIQKKADSIQVYETGYASLVANNGKYAAHPDNNILLKQMPVEHGYEKAKVAIEKQEVAISEHYSVFLKKDVTQVYMPIRIGETGQYWVMSTVVPTEEIMSESKEILMLQLVFGIIISVAIVGLISWIVSKVNGQLKNIAASLGRSADEVTSASKSVADTGTELSSAATEQAAALQETVSVVDEINSMIGKTAENAQRSIQNAQKSQQTIGSGKEAIQDMLQSMNLISQSNHQIMSQVEKNNSEFAEIMQVINEIENKTKVINDIVFQTKLLSFNASVEAARAGEHGKGFAVVAEEVGNLATMSGNAAKEIRALLDASTRKVQEIAETSKTSVSQLIQEGQKALDLGNRNVQRCQDAFVSIETDAQEVGEMIHEISSATQEQARGVEEMSKAMTQIDQMTQQNAGGAQQSAAAAEQLTQQAVYLNSLVQDLLITIEGGVAKPKEVSQELFKENKQDKSKVTQLPSDWEDLKAS